MKKVFVSYQHEDLEKVLKIVKILEDSIGLDVWIDRKGLSGGQRFGASIEKAICDADFFVIMISRKWFASDYCRKEFGLGCSLNKRFFPIYLEDCEMPITGGYVLELGSLHHINAYALSDDELEESLRKSDLVERYKRGSELYMAGRFDEAIRFFALAAEEEKSKEAQLDLGLCYMYGHGTEKNPELGAMWIRRAAESDENGQGLPQAQRELGKCYEIGEGVQPSETEAMKWYLKAAEEGQDMHAMYLTAMCYDKGNGVVSDKEKAFAWYSRAAEKGHPMSMYKTGYFYDLGIGVSPDREKAAEFYRRAAEKNLPEGINAYGVLLFFGQGVERNAAEAVKYYRRAAEMGCTNAQYNLATRYDFGDGVEQDPVQAYIWYEKAAQGGDGDAQYNIGISLYFGGVVPKDCASGLEWLNRAAENGNARAERFLERLRVRRAD